jgi:hypothetical protein
MKKILLFLFLLPLFVVGQNRFPSIDSAKNYSLRYVKNSAVESFTNLRMQNVVYGTLQLLDSLCGAGVIDTIWKSGDTLKYRIGNTTVIVGVFGGSGSTVDTTSLSNRINLKVNISDTANMLSPYLRSNVAAATYQPIGDYITTGSAASLQNLNITGTNGNGHIHLRHQASLPTATGQSTTIYANSQGNFAWKNDGNYHTTLKTDANTADRTYTFQNKDYTVADNAEVVKYTDTSAMLVNYLRANEAAATYVTTIGVPAGNGISLVKGSSQVKRLKAGDGVTITDNLDSVTITNTGVKYSDTSAMLSPYLRSNVAAATYATIAQNNLKLNITDTSAMLQNYLRANVASATYVTTIGVPSGDGVSLVKGTSQIKRLKAGSGISLTDNLDSVIITNTGIQWTGVDSSFAAASASNGVHVVDDFLASSFSSSAVIFPSGLIPVGEISFALENTRYGILTLSTAALTTGTSRLSKTNLSDSLNSLFNVTSYMVKIPTLSDGTETYHVRVGMTSQINTANPNGGAYFVYSTAGTPTGSSASTNWQCVTGNGSSVRTWTTTATAVTTGWSKLTVVASSSICFFYVNDVLVATHTTNIPTPALTPNFEIRKTAGTTARLLWIDYFTQDVKYSTAR